jgi:hypothetical protein
MVNNAGFNGTDKGSQASLGGEFGATDACPLILEYYVYYGSTRQEKYADYYVVLSKGNVLPPDLGAPTLPVAIPCVAYCKPWNSGDGNTKVIWYFDGKAWGKAGSPGSGGSAWNKATMTITTNDLTLDQNGGGTVTRQYKGTFDTISIYTKNFIDKSFTSIDDVSVTGGTESVTADLAVLVDQLAVVPHSSGRLPMAILGSADLDVTTIDFSSCNIAGVYPVKNKATYSDVNLDGYDDLELKFSRADLIIALGLDLLTEETVVDVTVDAVAGCDEIAATGELLVKP